MAAVGIALAGAGIGGALTGSITGAMIGYSIGSAVGSLLFPPDLGKVEGPRLQDLQIQSSAEGASIATVYGSGRIAGNIIWGKPIQEHRHKEKSGGKGGGGGQTVVSYTYTADFAVGLCEGPISAVRKLWADGKLIMDMSEPTQAEKDAVAAGGFLGNVLERQQAFYSQTLGSGAIRIYTGSESQLPDPLIEADLGAAQAPAWRGLAYIVFDGLELADYGNRIPNITAEVIVAGSKAPVYLGKVAIPKTEKPATITDDNVYKTVVNYMSSTKCVGLGIWANHNFPTSPVAPHYRATPITVYPSGKAVMGPDMPTVADAMPSNEYRFHPAYTDVPATLASWLDGRNSLTYFRWSSLDGTPPSIAVRGTYEDPSSWANGGGMWFLRGEKIYEYFTAGMGLYRFNALPVIDTSFVQPWDDVLSVSSLLGGDYTNFKYAWVTEEKAYIYYITTSPNQDRLAVYDLATKALINDVAGPYIGVTGGTLRSRLYAESDSLIYLAAIPPGGSSVILYSWDGSAWSTIGALSGAAADQTTYWSGAGPSSNGWFVGDGIVIWHIDANLHYWSIDAIASDGVPLSTIVADICARSGLESGDINVTDLASTTVRGYLRSTQMTGRSAIEPLARGFLFDAVESDGVLKFVRRGGATVATIAADELGAAAEGQQAERAITTLQQDSELPIELSVQYMDAERDYQVGSQRSRRLVPDSELSSSVQLPIVLNGTEAKRTAEVLQYIAWTERAVHQFALPLDRLALDPGDAIILPIAGVNRRVRLTRVTLGQVVECEAVADDATVYVSSAAAAPTTSAQQSVTVVGETIAALLDVPILRDADDDAGFYVAAAGTGSGWHGAALYRSIDQLEWSRITAMTAASVLGTCQTALPTGPTTIIDDGSTVDVRLFAGGLFSVSELQMLSGENTCAIGSPAAGWEIVSFQTATLQADGSYRLSRLLRGRRGTEWAVGGHGIGDMFVLLEAGDLVRPVPANTDIGVDRYYRAPAFGGDFNEADTITYRHQAIGKRPYAVAHVTGRRHAPATNDWTLSWVRRSRIDGEWRDYVDVPLGEVSESYEVDIMQGATVKRTITGLTSPSAVYTAAQQTTDFGAVQTSLSVRVYQMSATVGRGTVSAATI